MTEIQLVGGVKKLSNSNYNSWSTCLMSYLQGQDLWEVVNGSETVAPLREDQNGVLRKWRVKAGKALFVLKTTVEDEILEHIRDSKTPKEAWDILVTLYSKKNDSKLQLLENELLSVSQRDLTIPQYFHKIKTLCREIGELDPESKIGEARMKRIIIHGLKQEFRSFVAAVQGWPTQPTLAEFENLLASQENLGKQFADLSINTTVKPDAEALYANNRPRGRDRYKGSSYKHNRPNNNNEEAQSKRGIEKGSEKEKNDTSGSHGYRKSNNQRRRFPYRCNSCGRKGHMAKDCRSAPTEQGNTATVENEEAWDVHALAAHVEEGVTAHTATTIDQRPNRLDEWIVDSGCSNHLTGDKAKLSNPVKYGGSRVVVIADNSRHSIAHIGNVNFPSEDRKRELKLSDVYHVPGVKKNLLSVPQLTSEGNYVLFGPKDVQVFKEFETPSIPILKGHKNETVYVLSAEHAYVEKTKGTQNADLWHHRLGHVGYDKLKLMMEQSLVAGLPKVEVNKSLVCAGCQYGKAQQQPFSSSVSRAESPLALVHSDVFGPSKHTSIKGMRYMVSFIDDYSRYCWVYFMKTKAEVFEKFKLFEAEAERETGHKVGCLRSDNGGEYLSYEFDNYLKQRRIRRQLTCPNTPQQNGVSERKNRHLGEVTRCLVHAKNLPSRFWAEAMRTANYVINRTPSQTLKYVSPFERLFKTKPTVHYFRVFGSVCYVFVPNHLRHKMEKKAVRCVFVGYDPERKGWRCCDPNTGNIHVSRNVIFDETSSWWGADNQVLGDTKQLVEDLESSLVKWSMVEEDTENHETIEESPSDQPIQQPVQSQTSESEAGLRRSQREKRPNSKYAFMYSHVATVEDILCEPESFQEASQKQEWLDAMKTEMDALVSNQTWELVPKPHNVNLVSCKWVYKVKQKTDGTVDRFKARLVARGFSQEYGLDYEDTFSPVAKITTVRVLLALAACKGWKLWQMDVSNAFLYGELDHVIHMVQPMGFESLEHPEYVCKLKKAIYGLKQSPRAWYGKIAEFLEQNGYQLTSADSSLFVKKLGEKVVFILVYVDDLIISGDVEEEIELLKSNLSTRFKMKDLGRLKHFLGLELDYTTDGMVLHQRKYTSDLLHKFQVASCKPAKIPMDRNIKLYATEGKKLDDPTRYRKMVGSLIYLTLTRPDIAFAVGVLSRFMQDPRKPHMVALKEVLKYIKATAGKGIQFRKEVEPKLSGFCDADYAGDVNKRRSTTGYVFLFGSSPVSWCSKRQPTVSLSSTEAEYRAAAMAAQECVWLVELLKNLNQKVEYPVQLWCDNISAIKLAQNPVFHARTKHIEVHYHFIREKVLSGDISLEIVGTEEQVADSLTKSLSEVKLKQHSASMGIVEYDIERGC
ncbi:putative RNA-directed DNA polymerase [Helianthus annuus]|nr:putative RNA-directed DNA polymerase [Helianthus annuus]